MSLPINIIFDGAPGPVAGRFVEVETDEGRSIKAGEWVERPDGLWALRITELPEAPTPPDEMKELDNCICAEWDGKGWSTCGVPCPEHITAKSLRKEIANVREYLGKDPGTHPINKALYQLEQTRLPALAATLERLEARQ